MTDLCNGGGGGHICANYWWGFAPLIPTALCLCYVFFTRNRQTVRQSSSQRDGSVVSTIIGFEDVESPHPVPKLQRVKTWKRLTMSNFRQRTQHLILSLRLGICLRNNSPFDSFKFEWYKMVICSGVHHLRVSIHS